MSQEGKGCLVEGRLVWTVGNLFTGDTAMVYGTRNPKMNKQGQQYKEYGFGLAVPKSSISDASKFAEGQPGHFWAVMHTVAQSFYPSGVPANFKMKWIDGDTGKLQDGTPVNTKEGYPGHIVLSCKTTFPIKFFKWNGALNSLEQVSSGIKCGDYVKVQLSVSGHTGANASLYLNPLMCLHLADGKEIVNAPSATQVFGTAAPQVPSWIPQGQPMNGTVPGVTAPVHNYANPMQSPAMPGQPQYQQQPAPHYGVLPQVHQPQQPPAMPGMPMGNAPVNLGTGVPTGPAMNGPGVMSPAFPSNPGMPSAFPMPPR